MKNKRNERLGEMACNKHGALMKIVKYVNNKNVTVNFVGTEYNIVCRYSQFKAGTIESPQLPIQGNGRGIAIAMGLVLVAIIGVVIASIISLVL